VASFADSRRDGTCNAYLHPTMIAWGHPCQRISLRGAIFIFVMLVLRGPYSLLAAQTSIASMQATVKAIKTEKMVDARRTAAVRLSELTRTIAPDQVDDHMLDEMISLLDTPDDVVLNYVTVSLGNLGPRAKKAIPTLLSILPKADCVQGDRTAAAAIRPALRKMGAAAVPPKGLEGCKPN
jgi:hypothetical protein